MPDIPVPNSGYVQGVVGGGPTVVTTSTTIKPSDAQLVGIWCSTSGTIGVWNGTGTSAGNAVVAPSFAVTAGFWYPMPFHCTDGLYIFVAGGTPSVTVSSF